MEKYVEVKAEMHHFEYWLPDSADIASATPAYFRGLLEQAGFTIVGFVEHHFPLKGYTAVWLLAESHLAIHTFPESGKTFVQMSSCNFSKMESFKGWLQDKQA